MKLREFFDKYDLDRTGFAYKCGIPYTTLSTYIRGKHKPNQKVAERIEQMTDKLVTVNELRGKDDRDKYRQA